MIFFFVNEIVELITLFFLLAFYIAIFYRIVFYFDIIEETCIKYDMNWLSDIKRSICNFLKPKMKIYVRWTFDVLKKKKNFEK